MFEQSLLLDQAVGKKGGALAASFTAQTLAVGVLIAIPLMFTDRLPIVFISTPLSLPAPPPPLPPAHAQPASSSSTSLARASTTAAKPFRLPAHITALPQAEMGVIDAPPAYVGGVEGGVPGPPSMVSEFLRQSIPRPIARATEPASVPATPVRVGGEVQLAKLLRKVVPVYPPLAHQARISGTVQLVGIIAKDGTIQKLQVVSGHPLLVRAALDAVSQWIYRPTLLDGQQVEVIAPISVIFSLGQ